MEEEPALLISENLSDGAESNDDDDNKKDIGRYGKKGKMRCKLSQSLDASCYDKYDQ